MKDDESDLKQPLPKLVAFDLDYTLWPCWVDTHIHPPLRPTTKPGELVDKAGRKLSFFSDVPRILTKLQSAGVKIAACSRTHRPDIAHQALSEIKLSRNPDSSSDDEQELIRSIEFFDNLQIYPGSKLIHFRTIQTELKIEFDQILFFDDESRNIEVERLGVHFVLVDDSIGLNWKTFIDGLNAWRVKHIQK
ncbi:magnesium-dependent phosphatase-1 [Melampsora americana]|nr:magnesium-dependent phosphatase-1 [Melampsora americana]